MLQIMLIPYLYVVCNFLNSMRFDLRGYPLVPEIYDTLKNIITIL